MFAGSLFINYFVFLETGEWPSAAMARRIVSHGITSSAGMNLDNTPVGTPDPSRVGTPNHSEYSCAMEDDEVWSINCLMVDYKMFQHKDNFVVMFIYIELNH